MRSLNLFFPQQYIGAAFARAAGYCEGNIVVAKLDWANYWALQNTANQRVAFSMRQGNRAEGLIPRVTTIKIDNTNSPLPVYVYFQDTDEMVTCAPYSIVVSPVFTNSLDCQIATAGLSAGVLPIVQVEFMPFYVPPIVV